MGFVDTGRGPFLEVRQAREGELPRDAQRMTYGQFIFVGDKGALVIVSPSDEKAPIVFSEEVGLKEFPAQTFCLHLKSDGQLLTLGTAMCGSRFSIHGGARVIGTNNLPCYEVRVSSGHVAYVVFPLLGQIGEQGFFVAQNKGLEGKSEELRLYHRFGYGPACSVCSWGNRWNFRRTRS